jgi:metallo-beta-lactamase family protein
MVGYQAAGTRGRAIQDGSPTVRIHGRDVSVRAHVVTVDGLSAHADRGEILWWLSGFEEPPAHTYVVHGEPSAAQALAETLRRDLKWSASVAEDGATVVLPASAASRRPATTDLARPPRSP